MQKLSCRSIFDCPPGSQDSEETVTSDLLCAHIRLASYSSTPMIGAHHTTKPFGWKMEIHAWQSQADPGGTAGADRVRCNIATRGESVEPLAKQIGALLIILNSFDNFKHNIEIEEQWKGMYCVDLFKSFPTSIYFQESA